MLGKILNIGKKSEFYLELNEYETEATSSITEKTPAKTVETVEEATVSAPSPEATIEKVEEATVSAPSPEAKTASKAKKVAARKKAEKGTSSTSSQKESAKKPAAPAYSGASSWEEPFWVKAMYNDTSSQSSEVAQEQKATFSTTYLMGKSASRRRPGPSLNKFKEMARQKKF